MSSGKRVVVVAGTPELATALTELGAEVFVLAADDQLWSQAQRLHAQEPVDRVVSITERGLIPAAELTEKLDLPGNALATVQLLHDKRRMRDLLNSSGVSPVRVRSVTSAQDLTDFCQEVDGPVILKPAGGSGSFAIRRVANAAAAEQAWRWFSASGGSNPIAEEFLDGPEVSVEAFSYRGQHVIITVTDKLTQEAFVELGHTMPSSLPASTILEIHDLVTEFLTLIGLAEGPSHTEVKVTNSGPRIIESHNRIGGDKIRTLLKLAFDVDLVRETAAVVLGAATTLSSAPSVIGGAAVRFLTPEPGIVTSISVPEPDNVEIHLDVEVGTEVKVVRKSADRAGYVIAAGSDAAAAAVRAENIRDQIIVTTKG